MKPIREAVTQIIETAETNPEQAKTMLAQLHCNNIALVEFKVKVGDATKKGSLWINTDVDPQLQVYYSLTSYFLGSLFTEISLAEIEVKGIDEWETKWKEIRSARQQDEDTNTDIPTLVDDECSDDTGSEEMDPTESGEGDGVLFGGDSGQQAH